MLCGHDDGDTYSIGGPSELNGREVVSRLISPPFFNALSQTDACEFTVYGAMLYYKLWNHRNDMYHRGVPLELDKLNRQIKELASESLNLAAGVDMQEVGVVASVFFDEAGNLVAFVAKKVHVLLAFQGELEALAFGVALAKELHLGGVDFSSDCQQLVQALIVGSSPVWFLTLSFNELYHALVANDSHVVWISRVFNKAAHSLARWGLSHPCNGLLRFWEAALREGLPLTKSEEAFYLDWVVHSFRITNCGVQDTSQVHWSILHEIHTHMCYSNFNDIIHTIINMDIDLITIENSRSDEKLLSVFREGVKYGAGIGPGVYDIHSPSIPSAEEITDRINKMLVVLETNILWVNPNCGLKTRKYTEVKPALSNTIAAAKLLRSHLASAK
ncbi:hypothetical protein F8388_018749 [Cannabis sativa]|uniref:5-methyltetrahydropteroyltriglutamate--homocysteine S-methyltransferase n=1 Tax=Cannabis sativa TaxID=3483 RepID=A0A7J6GM97_CANSA|nr:hypothetical protein F8388_018749 [Cannabis sativa]